jgi:hypothetical protein
MIQYQWILFTFGGRVHVRWDNDAAVTPFGQLAFFIEFLKTSGVYMMNGLINVP